MDESLLLSQILLHSVPFSVIVQRLIKERKRKTVNTHLAAFIYFMKKLKQINANKVVFLQKKKKKAEST